MQITKFIGWGASVAALAAALPAQAQSDAPAQQQPTADSADAGQEIVVTGIRAALRSAEERKRTADVVVDGISADDIGLLPDVSISESLTRISGVTANDTPRGADQVAIRGLGPDLVSTEYNGRILPTADGVNRRVGLGGLPSEGLRGAFVQKTPDAESIEGGVAGILSLESIRPLESRRKGLTLVVRGLYDDMTDAYSDAEESQPFGVRGEATFVGNITDTLAVSLTYAGLKDDNVLSGVQLENWRTGTGPRTDVDGDGEADVLPSNAGPIASFFNTERHTGMGMIQWQASPAILVSIDGLYSDEKNDVQSRRFFAFNLFGGELGAPTNATVENGTVTAFEGQTALYRGVANGNAINDSTYGGGINFEVDDGGPLTLNADFSYFRASRDRFTPVVTFDTDGTTPPSQRRGFSYDIRDRSNVQFGFEPVAAGDFAIQQVNTTAQQSSDTIKAGRLDFNYELGAGLLRSIDFGLRYDNRRHAQLVDQTRYTFANLDARPDLDDSHLGLSSNPFASKADLFGGQSAVAFPYYDFDAIYALGIGADNVIVDDMFENQLGASFEIEEDTFALYSQANLEAGGLSGNVGLRYVLTDIDSRGQVGTTPADVADQSVHNSYSYLLPSLNLRYELTPNLIARLGAARTLSRPLFEQMRIGTAINVEELETGTVNVVRGNPELAPFTADGVDLGLEWYPDSATSIAVAGYYKSVTNFTTNEQRTGTIVLPDGTPVTANITEFVNDPEKRYFAGVEVQLRKDFDFLPGLLSNFGVQANYNFNDTDAREVFTSLSGPAAVSTTVEVLPINLSKHVLNAILYYDSRPFNMRLAYRYYSEYSRRFASGYQLQPGGQLDFNFGARIAEDVRLIGTVTNVLGSGLYRLTEDSRDPSNDRILQFYGNRGRNFTLGLRVQF